MASNPKANRESVPIVTLNAAKAFVLITVRLWYSAHDLLPKTSATTNWQAGFRAAGIDHIGTQSFDSLLTIFTASRGIALNVQNPCARYLSIDEAQFLHLLHLLQINRRDDAHMILAGWLPATAASTALSTASYLAESLHRAGLDINLKDGRKNTPALNFASPRLVH